MFTRSQTARSRIAGLWSYLTEPQSASSAPLEEVLRVLEEAKQLGFLGPGPVVRHVERSLPFLDLFPRECSTALDLGSGGGVPGLILAALTPHLSWHLLEGGTTRSAFLERSVKLLYMSQRVVVVGERAEVAARTPLRGTFDVVTARSFAAPGVTAECGAPFLRLGGQLIVAEPPCGDPLRWPETGLSELGLSPGRAVQKPYAFQVLHQTQPCPERYPRRNGIPSKRPLF